MGKNIVSSRVKQKNPKNKRNKTTLVFDEKARQEFLTGFRKRKAERRKVAQEQIIVKLKEEKKVLKQKKREELDSKWRELNLHCNLDSLSQPVTYDLSAHTVTVSDISQVDFGGTMGRNQAEETTEDRLQPATEESENSDAGETKTTGSSKKKHKKHKPGQTRHKNLTHLMSKRNLAKKKQTMKREQSGVNRQKKKKHKRRN